MASDNLMHSFGTWLRGRRREAGVAQEDLAGRIGCSLAALQKLESGERRPSRQVALLLANYFAVPPDEHEAFVTFARTTFIGADPSPSPSVLGPQSSVLPPKSPWRITRHLHTNLPSMLTALIGRERDETAVRHLLHQTRTRLVTLTGPPGVGKTRLGLQLAADMADNFEDGVFFVDLAAVVDPDMMLPAVAHVLGLRETGKQPIEQALLEHLRGKRLLLLLDNFEQVLDAAPALVELMQASPWLKVLVTSREALYVRGEKLFSVPPLDLPDPGFIIDTDGGGISIPESLAHNPAMQLFQERAEAVQPAFTLTTENARDVAAICTGLDGLPLAIELAAARADTLSPSQIRAGLSNRMQALTTGSRDMPLRQRTLRNALEWSYQLLSPEERRLFTYLGAFVGGCTPAALSAVASDAAGGSPITGVLASLARKSLLRQQEALGEPRLTMLETLREYASEQLLDTGERASIYDRHARYFLALAQEARPQLDQSNQKWWLDKLTFEHDNLRTALAWSLSAGHDADLGIGLAIAISLWEFWARQGFVTEGRSWLERLLVGLHPALAANNAKDADQEDIVAVLALHRLAHAVPPVLSGAGTLAFRAHDMINAGRYLHTGLALARRIGDTVHQAYLLNNLGNLSNTLSDFEAAIHFFDDALAIKRSTPGWDQASIASTLTAYSWALAGLDRFSDALAYNEESLAINRRLGDEEGVGRALFNMSELAFLMKDYPASQRYSEQVLEIAHKLGNVEGEAYSSTLLGDLELAQGRPAEAKVHITRGLVLFRDLEQQNGVLDCLVRLAKVAAALQQIHRAGVLAGAHAAICMAIDAPQLMVETGPDSVFAALLSDPLWAVAWAEGQAMTMPQVVAYALGQD